MSRFLQLPPYHSGSHTLATLVKMPETTEKYCNIWFITEKSRLWWGWTLGPFTQLTSFFASEQLSYTDKNKRNTYCDINHKCNDDSSLVPLGNNSKLKQRVISIKDNQLVPSSTRLNLVPGINKRNRAKFFTGNHVMNINCFLTWWLNKNETFLPCWRIGNFNFN